IHIDDKVRRRGYLSCCDRSRASKVPMYRSVGCSSLYNQRHQRSPNSPNRHGTSRQKLFGRSITWRSVRRPDSQVRSLLQILQTHRTLNLLPMVFSVTAFAFPTFLREETSRPCRDIAAPYSTFD